MGIWPVFNTLKNFGRDRLPMGFQVPAKFWYNWLRGSLEREMNLLGSMVKSNDRVIDVGGNRGAYAYSLWRLGARVEVFEPNPSCCCVLAAWAADKATVNVHGVALSGRSGSDYLHIPIDGAGVEHDASASIEKAGFERARQQLVALETLDSFAFEDVSLIKIDVEGHEYCVIEGGASTIVTSRPALLVEIEQRHSVRPIAEVFDKILGFGYEGFVMEGKGLMPLDTFDPARDQSMDNFLASNKAYINNFIFLHSDRLAAGQYRGLVGGASRR